MEWEKDTLNGGVNTIPNINSRHCRPDQTRRGGPFEFNCPWEEFMAKQSFICPTWQLRAFNRSFCQCRRFCLYFATHSASTHPYPNTKHPPLRRAFKLRGRKDAKVIRRGFYVQIWFLYFNELVIALRQRDRDKIRSRVWGFNLTSTALLYVPCGGDGHWPLNKGNWSLWGKVCSYQRDFVAHSSSRLKVISDSLVQGKVGLE